MSKWWYFLENINTTLMNELFHFSSFKFNEFHNTDLVPPHYNNSFFESFLITCCSEVAVLGNYEIHLIK